MRSAFANASFPMDAAHGFGVPQPVVWNGYMADATGNCQEGVRGGVLLNVQASIYIQCV